MHFEARNEVRRWETYDKNLTRLHYAAKKGNVELLSDCLKHSKCDINAKTCDGDTPLLLAAKYLHERAVQLLIESGADINCTDEDDWNILHHACRRDWLEIVQFIAQNKDFDINAKTYRGKTALMIAVEERHGDVARVLLKCGADVTCCDEKQWNGLHYASHFALYDVVDYVLKKKLCPLNDKTSSGDTPLLLAAFAGYESIVKLLLQCHADVNCCNYENWNLLHYAVENGWVEVVRLIVNRKTFDLNVQTSNGCTALHLACEGVALCSEQSLEIIDLLLYAGVDCNLKSHSDDRALNLLNELMRNKHASSLLGKTILLIKHGAYFTSSDYEYLCRYSKLKQHILKDKELCTRIVINNFKHLHLPAIYQIPGLVKHLPPLKNFQINITQTLECDVKKCVESEFETEQFCNVMEVRPMVLQMLCVRSLLGYHLTLKRSAHFCSNSSPVKKKRNLV